MARYSINTKDGVLIFTANNQKDALAKAYLLNTFYSELKKLPSRLWLLIYPALFALGVFGFYQGF